MCPPGYHRNGFVATHALGHMMYGYTLLVPMNQRVLNKPNKKHKISGYKWSTTQMEPLWLLITTYIYKQATKQHGRQRNLMQKLWGSYTLLAVWIWRIKMFIGFLLKTIKNLLSVKKQKNNNNKKLYLFLKSKNAGTNKYP